MATKSVAEDFFSLLFLFFFFLFFFAVLSPLWKFHTATKTNDTLDRESFDDFDKSFWVPSTDTKPLSPVVLMAW